MSIYSARADLKDLLVATGYTVHESVPDKEFGTAVVLEPADDYVLPGDTFDPSEFEVRHYVWCFVEYRSNEAASNELDTLLGQVLLRLTGSDHVVTTTTQPGPQTNGEWLAHGIRLTVETITTL